MITITALDLLKKLSIKPINQIVKVNDYSNHPTFKQDQYDLKMKGFIDAKYEITDKGKQFLNDFSLNKD